MNFAPNKYSLERYTGSISTPKVCLIKDTSDLLKSWRGGS